MNKYQDIRLSLLCVSSLRASEVMLRSLTSFLCVSSLRATGVMLRSLTKYDSFIIRLSACNVSAVTYSLHALSRTVVVGLQEASECIVSIAIVLVPPLHPHLAICVFSKHPSMSEPGSHTELDIYHIPFFRMLVFPDPYKWVSFLVWYSNLAGLMQPMCF